MKERIKRVVKYNTEMEIFIEMIEYFIHKKGVFSAEFEDTLMSFYPKLKKEYKSYCDLDVDNDIDNEYYYIVDNEKKMEIDFKDMEEEKLSYVIDYCLNHTLYSANVTKLLNELRNELDKREREYVTKLGITENDMYYFLKEVVYKDNK